MALQPQDAPHALVNSAETLGLKGDQQPSDKETGGGPKEGAGGANVVDSSSSSSRAAQDPSLISSEVLSKPPSSLNDAPPPAPPSNPGPTSPDPSSAAPPPSSAPTSSSSVHAPPSSSPLQPTSPLPLQPPTDLADSTPAASEPASVSAPSPVPSPSLPPPTSSSTPPIPTTTSSSSSSTLHFTHPIKKFTAVSVNKKFLSNTTPASSSSSTATSAPSTLKSSLSTSSTAKLPPIQPPHAPSRLLTTRLVHPTPRVAAPPPVHAGWARPTPSPGATTSKPGELGAAPPSLFKSRGGDSFSWGPGPAGAAGDRRGGLRNQFPTTAESAEERRVNAQAAKEAAAEKSQAVLLELDAFRGVHLDPNAHHWDDVDDEDDDFLDDVVEFGDGTQYTIDHTQPPPEVEQEEEKQEQQRYPPANDFDRSWPQKQGGPPSQHPHPPSSRAPPPHQQSNYRPSSSPSSSDHHLHYPPPSQPHAARPPPSSAHLPSKPRAGEDPSRVLFNARSNQFETPGSGRPGPPQGSSGSLGAGGGGPGRRPSNDRQPIRGFDRPPPPHVELQRAAPPHLQDQGRGGLPPPSAAANAPAPQPAPSPSRPAWGLAREGSSRAGGVGLGGLSSPPAAANKDFPPPSALSVNRSALPPQSNVFATAATLPPPAPNPRSARVSFSTLAPTARPPSSVGSPETALHHLLHPSLALRRTSTEHGGGPTPTQVVEDLSAMQKDEMHSAADRAKLRRQKEEEERQAAIERAKAKAKALEEKFAPKKEVLEEVEEKKDEVVLPVASLPTPVPAPVAAPSTPTPTPPATTPAPALAPSTAANSSSVPGTPARPTPVEKWKLNGNLLPSAGLDTPPPPRILKGAPIPDDVQVIDFANLGSLVASQQASSSRSSTPQPSPTKSRRPVATDFFDHPPPPSLSSTTSRPFSSLTSKVESSLSKSPSVSSQLNIEQQHSLPPRPPPSEASTTPSLPPPPPPAPSGAAVEARSSSKAPPSPTKGHHIVELSSFDNAMARFKQAMGPSSSTAPPSSSSLSTPPSPTKSSSILRPLSPPEPESDQTKPDRPTSPVLAWKVYPVRLPSARATRRPLIDSKQAKLYNRADTMIKVVDPVSWEPPLWKTPLGKGAGGGAGKERERDASRDELLLKKVAVTAGKDGKVVGPAVFLPTKRGWERLKTRAEVARVREEKARVEKETTNPTPSPLPSPSPSPATVKPTPSPTPKPTLPASHLLPGNPALPLPPTSTPTSIATSPSLPTRPVPALAVIPPTPLRPIKPSRAMEESSWRRRAPLPEIVVAEQEKVGEEGRKKEEGVESIAIGETTEGGMVVLNRSTKGVEVRVQARAAVVENAPEVVVVVAVRKEEEKKTEDERKQVEEKTSPTVEIQQPPPPQPTVDLSTPPSESGPSKSSSSLKLPEGSDVGFYRDRSPSIGTVSQEQLEPLVRFMVTSEIDSFHAEELGPKSTDPGVEEDVPEFASIMRSPSSSGGADLSRTESSTSIPRLPINVSGVVLSPPSAATSSAWSKSVPKVDREQQVRDVWAQSSSSSSSSGDPSRNAGGPFPSSLHFSSLDLHSSGGHQNNSGSIRSFAGGPQNNNRGQFAPQQQQQQRNFVGGQQQPQGFPSPYTPLSRPNGASQPNSPAMYQSSFNSGSPRPNPSAPAFQNPQLGRNPPSLNQGISPPHRPSFNAYSSNMSISSSGSSQGHQQQQQPGGGGGSMMYSSQQPTLNPTSQPFQMRPSALAGMVPPPLSSSSLPPPFGVTPGLQGVWLPVVPVPPLRPNPQQQQSHGSYSGLSSPSPAFSSPSLHPHSSASPYSSQNSLPSPNLHSHNLNHFNSSPNLPHHAPTYRNLSDFSSSPNSNGGFGGGRQAPPHQPQGQNQNQHGMFSSNGRGGPMDNHARGGSSHSAASSNSNNNPSVQQPIYASIGGPQQSGQGYGGGGYAGGGSARRW